MLFNCQLGIWLYLERQTAFPSGTLNIQSLLTKAINVCNICINNHPGESDFYCIDKKPENVASGYEL